jgi:LEA14-like dessication related protein
MKCKSKKCKSKKCKPGVLKLLLLMIVALILGSCASKGVRDQSPFIQVNSLKMMDETISLDLGIRNVNIETLLIGQIEFSISLNETSLAVYKAASQASVPANGIENLHFELNPSVDGVALLNELQNDERPNLEYSIEGVLFVNEGDEMKVLRKGHIYRVPGRPGQFR